MPLNSGNKCWQTFTLAGLLFLIIVFGVGIGVYVFREYRALDPRPAHTTLRDFPHFLPAPQAIVRFHESGKEYTVIFGKQPLVLFSEMPAGYLFDSNGSLLDWSVEATDVDHLNEFWSRAQIERRQGRELTYEDLGVR